MSWPGSTVSAKASETSSVIGIGQSVPSASASSRRRCRNRPAQEALERVEAAVHQQLEVAELARVRSQDGRSAASILSFCALS
jgi:hypothetical protein